MTPTETKLTGFGWMWRQIRLVLALWAIEIAMKLWPKQTPEDAAGQLDMVKAFMLAQKGDERLRP